MPASTPASATATLTCDGLPFIAVANPHATARIYLQGGQVAQWRPAGHAEVLWMSARSLFVAGKPIRGGVPVCFPWFGPHPERPELGAHGFARTRPWTLERLADLADGRTEVVLTLATDEASRAQWPHDVLLTMTVTVGATLAIELAIANRGGAAMPCEVALHTYLAVGDIRRTTLEGLAGATCIDKIDGAGRRREERKAISFAGETDLVYLGTDDAVTVVDPLLGRRLVVAKRGARSTVVWNPWVAKAARMPDFGDHEWPGMLCVETANVADDRLTVPPGATHRLGLELAVAR
jgi:glucose-6-phosphate 1-epimerase